jgi:hypothetical protein
VVATRNARGKLTLAIQKGLEEVDREAVIAMMDQVMKDFG